MMVLPLRREVVLARPLADVQRYLRDFSTIEQWDPGVIEAVKRTPGPVVVGTEFDLVLDFLGRPVPMQYTLTTLTDDTLVLTGHGEGFQAVDTLRLQAEDAHSTRLFYAADLSWNALPGWSLPLLKVWGRRLADQAMRGLQRALAEDGPVQPGPLARLGERLILPGMWNYTRRGYRRLPSRGLSRSMAGRWVGITGVTSGLGLAMAQQLGRLGASLVLVGRGEERLQAAAEAVRDFAGAPVTVHCLSAELSSVADTYRLLDVLQREFPQLDVWINNAGALFDSHALTAEGHERALAVNFLSPAILARGLAPAIGARGGRIINMVSGGLYSQGLRLQDMNFANEPYNGPKAYARAKRALLDLSQYWAAQAETGQACWHVVHPGWADTPGVAKSLPGFRERLGPRLRNSRMGADTAVWLASHPDLGDRALSGRFWFDRASRPTALLPGTSTCAADVDRLLDWFSKSAARPAPAAP